MKSRKEKQQQQQQPLFCFGSPASTHLLNGGGELQTQLDNLVLGSCKITDSCQRCPASRPKRKVRAGKLSKEKPYVKFVRRAPFTPIFWLITFYVDELYMWTHKSAFTDWICSPAGSILLKAALSAVCLHSRGVSRADTCCGTVETKILRRMAASSSVCG